MMRVIRRDGPIIKVGVGVGLWSCRAARIMLSLFEKILVPEKRGKSSSRPRSLRVSLLLHFEYVSELWRA